MTLSTVGSSDVDGGTRLLGIVGDPVAQTRSPAIWTALFRANGVNAVCLPFHVAAPALPAFVAGLRAVQNLLGVIVTIPHKQAAARLAEHLTDRARLVGSANLLRPEPDGSWTGDIVDGVGFVGGLVASGQRIAGRRALVVGAGGVGTAIAFALAEAGAASVHVFDVLPDRATDLARRIEAAGTPAGTAPASAAGFDLVVNASPLGMRPDDTLPIDPAGLQPDAIAGDVVVRPDLTPWLQHARDRGCHVQAGTVMMDYQIAATAAFLRLQGAGYDAEAVARLPGQVAP